jgi:hypothetical protein
MALVGWHWTSGRRGEGGAACGSGDDDVPMGGKGGMTWWPTILKGCDSREQERGGVVCGGHVAKEDVRNGRGSVRWSAGRQRPGNSARGQVVAPTHRMGACPRTGVVVPLTCGPGHSVGRLKPFKSVNSI